MRAVYIAGEPATGKTTLMLKVISRLGMGASFEYKKVKGSYHDKTKTWVVGIYQPDVLFGGTDRLAMTVIGDAIEWLGTLSPRHRVILEGDRLANARFLNALGDDRHLFMLIASPEVKARRHKERGDTQSDRFLLSRKTKCENLFISLPFKAQRNETAEELERNVDEILCALLA